MVSPLQETIRIDLANLHPVGTFAKKVVIISAEIVDIVATNGGSQRDALFAETRLLLHLVPLCHLRV